MIGEFIVLLFISFENLLLSLLKAAKNFVISVISIKMCINGKKGLIVLNVLTVNGIEIALTKTRVINGIQKIRLPHSVVPNKTINVRREGQMGFFVILKGY